MVKFEILMNASVFSITLVLPGLAHYFHHLLNLNFKDCHSGKAIVMMVTMYS